jgi:hypothetical protein
MNKSIAVITGFVVNVYIFSLIVLMLANSGDLEIKDPELLTFLNVMVYIGSITFFISALHMIRTFYRDEMDRFKSIAPDGWHLIGINVFLIIGNLNAGFPIFAFVLGTLYFIIMFLRFNKIPD